MCRIVNWCTGEIKKRKEGKWKIEIDRKKTKNMYYSVTELYVVCCNFQNYPYGVYADILKFLTNRFYRSS